jgi:hypothetical protein
LGAQNGEEEEGTEKRSTETERSTVDEEEHRGARKTVRTVRTVGTAEAERQVE